MKIRVILILFILGLILTSCKKDEPTPLPQPVERVFADVVADFNQLDMTPGIHDVHLTYLNGKVWNFRIIAPEVSTDLTYPLIIDLHGASGGNPDVHTFTDCYLEEGFANKDVFMIIPNGGALDWINIINQEMVVTLTNFAKDNWPINEEKIAVTGYSNGGIGAWFYGETQSDLFSAALPMASSYSTYSTTGEVRVIPIPMYCIHGENDELFPLSFTQAWVEATNNAGSNVTLVVADNLGHYESCSYKPFFNDAVDWLFDEIWD